ncbi:DinB family protein [Olivibacter domesticus]|uniref:DinB superfamily protein n=1 Tax=Olivibacter domesticus TaxID=407022 RepID=A0A1H7M5Z0_OLID1|nr:DinB family protein [Olivibacter domesticus]SEL06613.1 DinB superfamily protein [Olivibacter domesticus]
MEKLEVWMRGPIKDIPDLLQPVAHALLQVDEELFALFENFPRERLWLRPMGLASIAFHLQHIPGVIDRMLTYAAQNPLSEEQLRYLELEGKKDDRIDGIYLLNRLHQQIIVAIETLKNTKETALSAHRTLGRKKIPTTLIGLLFHAAEHAQRHVGQAIVTRKIVLADHHTNSE